jgi:hypothetical protein
MANVITFKDAEGFEFEMEGDDVLVIKVNLAKKTGTTNGGNPRFGTTFGIFPIVAGEHKVRLNLNVYG